MIFVSYINLLIFGKDNGGDQEELLEFCVFNIGVDEEEIFYLYYSFLVFRDSEVIEEGIIQFLLFENEFLRLDNIEEEIRFVLNLEFSVFLDLENFLMILKILEN